MQRHEPNMNSGCVIPLCLALWAIGLELYGDASFPVKNRLPAIGTFLCFAWCISTSHLYSGERSHVTMKGQNQQGGVQAEDAWATYRRLHGCDGQVPTNAGFQGPSDASARAVPQVSQQQFPNGMQQMFPPWFFNACNFDSWWDHLQNWRFPSAWS